MSPLTETYEGQRQRCLLMPTNAAQMPMGDSQNPMDVGFDALGAVAGAPCSQPVSRPPQTRDGLLGGVATKAHGFARMQNFAPRELFAQPASDVNF